MTVLKVNFCYFIEELCLRRGWVGVVKGVPLFPNRAQMGFRIDPPWNSPKVFKRVKLEFTDNSRVSS